MARLLPRFNFHETTEKTMQSIFIFFPSLFIACQQDNHNEVASSQEDVVHSDSTVLKPAPISVKELEEPTTVEVQEPVKQAEVVEPLIEKEETVSKTEEKEVVSKQPSKNIAKRVEQKEPVASLPKVPKSTVEAKKEAEHKELPKVEKETSPLEKITRSIEQTYSQISSIDVDFEQTIHNEALDQDLVQTGSLHIMKPNYFLWDIQFPMEQQYYFNGAQLRVWNPMNQQLLVSEHAGTEGDVASILGDLSSISQKYQVKLISQNDRFIRLMAYPYADTGCESLKLTVDAKTYYLSELTSQCSQTGDVHLSFGTFSVNKRTSPEIFTWTPPQGAEIITSTELYD